jgi:RimJ/RimL family protein N-acetyltransferase
MATTTVGTKACRIDFPPRVALQRTPEATEALFMMMQYAFDELRYRRLVWKCNAANEPSRRAAERLVFRFEGIFCNHLIVDEVNRDTA